MMEQLQDCRVHTVKVIFTVFNYLRYLKFALITYYLTYYCHAQSSLR